MMIVCTNPTMTANQLHFQRKNEDMNLWRG